MAFKLFQIQQQFMINTFSDKLSQFEKTGSLGKLSLGKMKTLSSTFKTRSRSHFLFAFTRLLFESAVSTLN